MANGGTGTQHSQYGQLQQFAGRMNSTNSNAEPEREIWRGNFSAKSMFGAWVGALAVTVAVLFAIVAIEELQGNPYVWLFGLGFILLTWAPLIVIWLFKKLAHHYTLTTCRLLHRDGIFIRNTGLVELIDIDDVSYQQGPVQAILGVGNIIVLSSDTSHPTLSLRGIANVREVADKLDEARRKERRERGLHIEHI